MKQVCIIHGGSTYETDADFVDHLTSLELRYDRLLYRARWTNWLGDTLTDFDVLLPQLPNAANARYEQWALYFSKIVPLLRADAILIGHSLGGIFLAKYLAEHAPSFHFSKVILVAAPYDDESEESLASFRLPKDMAALSSAADSFALVHSKDDPVVPFSELAKYRQLLPNATICIDTDKGHYAVPTLPSIVKIICG